MNIFKCNLILIGDLDEEHTSEEASHFLHVHNSHIKYLKRNVVDAVSSRIIMEMLGFFGSKLLCPKRINPYRISEPTGEPQYLIDKMEKIFKSEDGKLLGFIYQEGYILGEKLFDSYLAKNISKRRIRNLFRDPLEKEFDPACKFFKLKYQTLNFSK